MMNAQHLHNIWRLEHQIHYQEGDIVRYVRNGETIQLSVCYCKSIRVHQGTYFATFASPLDMKRNIFRAFDLMREKNLYMHMIKEENVAT
jgi:hypothetical protein